jgi:hypothetical protein
MDETKEASAFAILLLYTSWGEGGDRALEQGSAVVRLQQIKALLPEHVRLNLAAIQQSEQLCAVQGEPPNADELPLDAQEAAGDDSYDGDDFAPLEAQTGYGMQSVSLHDNAERVWEHARPELTRALRCFVEGVRAMHNEESLRNNVLSDAERLAKEQDPSRIFPVPRADELQQVLDTKVARLNSEQLRAYHSAVNCISGAVPMQMVMLVSGEGGTGKSTVIEAVSLYTQIYFGKTVGSWGAVLKTAPTGGAAHNIGGSTWHSALNKTKPGITDLKPATVVALQRKAAGTQLFVIDEISLLSCEELLEISMRLSVATGHRDLPFGGLHTMLVGDFYQMRPVRGVPIVQKVIPLHKVNGQRGRDLFVNSLTHYCLLIHNVRAQQTAQALPPLAAFLTKARVGDLSNALLLSMNDRVRNTMAAAAAEASPKALWITDTHNKVDRINTFFRERRLRNSERLFRIIARHAPQRGSDAALTAEIRDRLYNDRGDRKGNRKEQMVSYMELFIDTRVRLTRNLYVEGGLYNGAMGTVWGFVFSGSSIQIQEIDGSTRIFGKLDDAQREIPIVLVQMDGDDRSFPYTCCPSVPRLVPITEIQATPLVCELYHRFQLPILPAEARTGHSVQGYTAHDGVVVEPGSQFFAGDYTAISRAQSKDAVLLLAPLRPESFTDPPPKRSEREKRSYRDDIQEEYARLHARYPAV